MMKHLLNDHCPIILKTFNEQKHSSKVHSNKAKESKMCSV